MGTVRGIKIKHIEEEKGTRLLLSKLFLFRNN